MMNVVQAQAEPAPTPAAASVKQFRLKRSGIRPKVFQGVEVCHSMSYEMGTPFWYEINIYRTTEDGFVSEVKFFTKSDKMRDSFKTVDVDSTEELVAFFEGYDPTEDIDPGVVSTERLEKNAVFAATRATELAQFNCEAKRQWNDIVGEILFEIDRA